ncbi:MAG: ROK family protein [Devosia sp.]|nr:ROK family protein [Devosia sp.]
MSDPAGPLTLSIDVGGSGLKTVVIDAQGQPVVERRRVPTPHPAPPSVVLAAIEAMAAGFPAFDRISVGFPGVVKDGRILTAPHLGTADWQGFDLAQALSHGFGRPARVLNDAEVQGFGVITGTGLEMVLTLGTGAGTALFRRGELMPHLELSQHPIRDDLTYDEYIGNAALEAKGHEHWNRRIEWVLKILYVLTNFDTLHLGGGNAEKVKTLPPNVLRGSNEAGLTGGVKLWGDGWPKG